MKVLIHCLKIESDSAPSERSGVFRIWQRRGHGERGSGDGAPSGVQGQSPWSGGQGAKPPLKLRYFLLLNVQWKPKIRPFF